MLMVQGRMVSVKLEKLTALSTHSFVLVAQRNPVDFMGIAVSTFATDNPVVITRVYANGIFLGSEGSHNSTVWVNRSFVVIKTLFSSQSFKSKFLELPTGLVVSIHYKLPQINFLLLGFGNRGGFFRWWEGVQQSKEVFCVLLVEIVALCKPRFDEIIQFYKLIFCHLLFVKEMVER